MGDPRGFLKIARQAGECRDVCERVLDFKEVAKTNTPENSRNQASRCMDCSTPFCHWGCPIGNYIPEWNDYMFKGNWAEAAKLLEAANNLPEVTARICPALCEYSCVLGLNDEAVTIRENELAVVEAAFKNGLIKAGTAKKKTGKKIAIVGSGPAGLSCASQLVKAGHQAVVFEKDALPGGILRYGIPDFKLEKKILDRRINIWKKEGVVFRTGIEAGKGYPAKKLLDDFDALCLAGGCRIPRDLKIEGRQAKGIYFAMDYLIQANRRVAGDKIKKSELIDAKDKKVVVIGGGDSGADCVGTAHRQKAKCVVQIEIMPAPAQCRTADYPWPRYPLLLKNSTSHQEGGARRWSVMTKRFLSKGGFIKGLSCLKAEFDEAGAKGCLLTQEVPGSEFCIEADLVILALGFLHPEHEGLLYDLGLEFDSRGNVKTDEFYRASREKVFCAGDMRRGQSLVVWAISEGRRSAHFIDKYLMGESNLPLI